MKKKLLFIALLTSCVALSGCFKDKEEKKREQSSSEVSSISEVSEPQSSEESSSSSRAKPSSIQINPPSYGF